MKITFTFLESLGLETFPESYQKCSCEHHTNVDQRKLRHADILALCMLYAYIYIYIYVKQNSEKQNSLDVK